MRFKLLRGLHSHKGVTYEAGSANDIVESPTDLEAQFGREKFKRLHEADTASGVAVAEAPIPDGDGLEDMTVGQLREYAEGNEIDLGEARKKDEIIAVIRGERG